MGMKENAFAYIDAHRSEMLKMWEELVSIDSGSDYNPVLIRLLPEWRTC